LQTNPVTQSLATVHVVAQLVPLHANAPHAFGTSLQRPTPSHELRCVSTPAAHAVALHGEIAAFG
jgi:hypothetical protein